MKNLFNAITFIAAGLMVLFILLQSRGSSIGGAFGGDSNFYRSKRGAEKLLFNATIVAGIIFTLSVVLSILSKT